MVQVVHFIFFREGACVLSHQSCPTLCDPMEQRLLQAPLSMDSPGKNTGVGCHALLQGIFPTQGWNPGLPHYRWILYHLRHQGSPRTLKRVAYPFSRGSFQPRNWTRVSCIAGRFFTCWATREAMIWFSNMIITIWSSNSTPGYISEENENSNSERCGFQCL